MIWIIIEQCNCRDQNNARWSVKIGENWEKPASKTLITEEKLVGMKEKQKKNIYLENTKLLGFKIP